MPTSTQPKNHAEGHSTTTRQPATTAQRASSATPSMAPSPEFVQRAQASPHALTPTDIISLQRQIGNQAVQRMLSTKSSLPIQPKLKVGPANDIYEQEADRIARTVIKPVSSASKPAQPSSKSPSISRIQRSAPIGAAGGEVDQDVERRLRSSQSGGKSMPDAVRHSIEPKVGADLSSVKVHTDSNAVQLNRDLGAKAFTHGSHIYYGAGQSPHDVQLTAHEAVHTIQQGAVASGTLQRKKKKQRVVDTDNASSKVPNEAEDFRLTLAVWQDDPNFLTKSTSFVFKKAAHSIFGGKKPQAPKSTGHSWVELRAYDDADSLVFSDSYGFQPGGVMHPETGFHGSAGEDKLYRDYKISKDKFVKVIGTADAIVKEDPEYDLKGMNCTKFARTLVQAAGLSFMGNRVVPGAKIGPGKAFTPNRLFSAMKGRKKQGKTYSLTHDRKDSTYVEPPKAPKPKVTMYFQPFEDSMMKYDHENASEIKSHRPSPMDEGWSEVILMGEEGEETWYALTDTLNAFLSQATVDS